MSWWSATNVSVTNNTNIVTVTTGDDTLSISPEGGLVIGSYPPVEVVRGYIDNSVKKIELKRNWTFGTVSNQAAVLFPTDADLNSIAVALNNYLANFTVATQAIAEAGTDNAASMTALRVKQAIDFFRKEATQVQAEAGALTGVFMSPVRTLDLIKTSGLLGTYIPGAETDLNSIGSPRTTRFFYTSDTTLNRPTADTRIYAGLQIAAQTSVVRQIVWCANTGIETMYMRTGNGSGTITWTAWREVWHSGNTVKQTSNLDTTAGALLTVGSFGIGNTSSGAQFSSLAISLDATTIPTGFYRVVNGDTGTKPSGVTDFNLLSMRYNVTDSAQIAIAHQTGKMYFRTYTTSAWTAWKALNNDLVLQTAPFDTTAGSVLTVGAGGLLGGATDVPDFTASTLNVNRWGRFLSTAVSKPSFMNAGAFVTAQYDGTPTTYFLGAGLKTDNNTFALFGGKRNSPGVAPTWYEMWDKTQAPVQSNKQDTTANAVLQNGAFEIGSNYLQNQFVMVGTNGVWTALSEYVGNQATLTNGWVYRIHLNVYNTGVSNGALYYLTQSASGTWVARQAGIVNPTGVNHASLRVSTALNTLELTHSNTGTPAQSICVWIEAWYTNNVTIQSPSWFGNDPYIRRDFTTGLMEVDRSGTYYGLWDKKDKPAQANRYDNTAGAMLQSGSFGWGTTTFATDGFGSNATYITDANALTVSGAYATGNIWTGSPIVGSSGTNQGCLIHLAWGSASYCTQIFYRMQTDHANHMIRFKDNGVWSSWQKFLTTDALSAPAQANPYDTAAAALLRPGSFGWGTNTIATTVSDADALRVSGVYRVGTSWTGSVITGTSSNNQGILLHLSWTTLYGVQLHYNIQNKLHYIRHLNSGVWSTWDLQYNSTNAIGSVTNVSGQNTGGLLEYGSGVNGSYYKYADGRLECFITRSGIAMTADTDNQFDWVFPAVFASAPTFIKTSITGASATHLFNVTKDAAHSQTTTGASIRTKVSVSQTHTLAHVAIGRWR
jgi:hypothetical protein